MNNVEFPNIPRVGDFKTRKEWEVEVWHELLEWFAKLDAKTLKIVLESVMSAPERQFMIKRSAAMARLRNGARYRDIGHELWLAPQTISSIKKAFLAQSYASNWEKVKAQKQARIQAWIEKRHQRREPKFYRRTKYGRMPVF